MRIEFDDEKVVTTIFSFSVGGESLASENEALREWLQEHVV